MWKHSNPSNCLTSNPGAWEVIKRKVLTEEIAVDRESGDLGEIRTGCEDWTQDRDGKGYVEEMA